jgi:hypothetical protein
VQREFPRSSADEVGEPGRNRARSRNRRLRGVPEGFRGEPILSEAKNVVSRIFASWNQISAVLRRIHALRRAV